MYFNIGPSKKDLYKIILLLICLLFTFRGCVKAENAVPTIMEYYNANGQLFTYGGPANINSYTIPFYTLYRTYDGLTTINAMYGQPSGVSGKYFSFYMYSPNNSFRTVSAFIQLVSGDYLSCNIDNSLAINDIYTATCDLSNFGNSFTVYKYGFQWQPQADYSVPETNTSQYRLSKIFYFDNANSYNAQIASNTQEINNNINDSSIDDSSASDLTGNSAFQDQNGLQAIIHAPLNFIQSLTSTTCSAISLTIPYIDADVSLPCMSSVYNKALGQQLVNLIALVINGVVLYRYCLKILQIVKDAKNPNKDGLEVLDL